MREDEGTVVPAGDSDTSAQALCRECGFCCDGTLFATAVIAENEEVEWLRTIGIMKISEDGRRFSLPCSAYDRVCTIYESGRPRTCGGFRCRLLRRHESGDVSLEAALEIVRAARAHRETVAVQLSTVWGALEGNLVKRFEALWASLGDARSREHSAAMVNFVALKVRLKRHFLEPRGSASPASASAPPKEEESA